MRRYVLQFGFGADTVQHADDTDEVTVAPIRREDERGAVANRYRFDAVHRRLPDHPDLSTALGVGEPNAVLLAHEPWALQGEHLHPPEPCQQHETDRRQPGGVFTFRLGGLNN